MSTAALILAGGSSRRMGTPKALLTYEGETFADRLIGVLGNRCSEVVVVLGYEAERVRAGLSRAGQARFVVNGQPELGQLSSMQCGLRLIGDGITTVLFTPVDIPSFQQLTLERMLHAARDGAPFIIPRTGGKRGHPVLFSASLIQEFLSLPAHSDAREVVNRYRAVTHYVDVDDPGILRDIDTPAEYGELLALKVGQHAGQPK